MYKAKVEFLWYQEGQEINDDEVQQNWIDDKLVEKISKDSYSQINKAESPSEAVEAPKKVHWKTLEKMKKLGGN